jgi:hypothetical protein
MAIEARWERVETLALESGGTETTLATYRDGASTIFSQRRFLVAPDGNELGFAEQLSRVARLIDGQGGERTIPEVGSRDFRYHHNGDVVAVTGPIGGDASLVVLSKTGLRTLGVLGVAQWIEPTRDGVVAFTGESEDSYRIVLTTMTGAQRTLAAPKVWIPRLMAARSSSPIAWIDDGRVTWLDEPTAKPTVIGKIGGRITNGEMAPDGSAVVVAGDRGVQRFAPGKKPERLSQDGAVHSLWFDGNDVAFASPDRAVVLRAAHRRELDGRGELAGMRVHRRDGGLVVARGREALHWKRDGSLDHLATVDESATLLGADVFAGGLALWTAKRNALPPSPPN